MATMKEQVKAYLDNHAKEDAVFAEKMKNERKSLDNCIKFIVSQAHKYMNEHKDEFRCDGGMGGDIDDEICFGWANHYYDETDLEIDMTDEERKAKRDAERAEREKNAPKTTNATKTAKKDTKKAKSAGKDGSPKTEKKTYTHPLLSAPKKAEKTEKVEKPKSEKKVAQTAIKKGADCYDLFGEFFN